MACQATLKSRIHPVAVARLKAHSLDRANIEYETLIPQTQSMGQGARHRPNRLLQLWQSYPSDLPFVQCRHYEDIARVGKQRAVHESHRRKKMGQEW